MTLVRPTLALLEKSRSRSDRLRHCAKCTRRTYARVIPWRLFFATCASEILTLKAMDKGPFMRKKFELCVPAVWTAYVRKRTKYTEQMYIWTLLKWWTSNGGYGPFNFLCLDVRRRREDNLRARTGREGHQGAARGALHSGKN
jgi:hypothetical protein